MKPPDPIDRPLLSEADGSAACAASRSSMQRRFDGECSSEAEETVRHRASCAACRSWEVAARLLEEGLKRTARPVPPAGLADRIMAQMRAEPVRERRRSLRVLAVGFALAASVLIAVVAIERGMRAEPLRVTIVTRPMQRIPAEPTPVELVPLGASMDEAGEAVAALTRKTADGTINLRLPTWTLPKVADAVDPLERLEPAVASIQEFQHGAVFSVAPITNSAKRAVDMFWREIGPEPVQKQAID